MFTQVEFCGRHAFRCDSNFLKVALLEKLIPYIVQFPVKIPDCPLDARLKILLRIIHFNTLNRYNTLLFFTKTDEKCNYSNSFLIEKRTGNIYLIMLRVNDSLYKDSLFDGTLIEDRHIYPPQDLCADLDQNFGSLCQADLSFDIEEYIVEESIEDLSSNKDQRSEQDSDQDSDQNSDQNLDQNLDQNSDQNAEQDLVDIPLRSLVRVGRSIIDGMTEFEEMKSHKRWKFFVGNVYALRGKLIDSTHTCYQKMELLNQVIKNKDVWKDDDSMHLFTIHNHIVGSYFLPKTKQEQQNAFHNDYTRYNDQLLQIIKRNTMLIEQYNNTKNLAKFEIKKSDVPFCYELWLDSKEKYGNCFNPNSETEHYITQLFRKMKPPIIVKCIYNNEKEMWTPIEHAYGEKKTSDLFFVKRVEKS
jgi:hypothetical protein